MSIQIEPSVVGKVTAKLQEERAEVTVHTIEVVMIHHGRGSHNPWVALSGLRIPSLFRTKYGSLFLCLTDEDYTLFTIELRQPLFGDLILPLALPELHDWDVVLFYKSVDRFNKLLADRTHQCRRCDNLLAVISNETHCSN